MALRPWDLLGGTIVGEKRVALGHPCEKPTKRPGLDGGILGARLSAMFSSPHQRGVPKVDTMPYGLETLNADELCVVVSFTAAADANFIQLRQVSSTVKNIMSGIADLDGWKKKWQSIYLSPLLSPFSELQQDLSSFCVRSVHDLWGRRSA